MANDNTIFSTNGFYFGVAVFALGLCLMVARVVLEVNDYNYNIKESATKKEKTEKSIDESIQILQETLDKKIQEQEMLPTMNFDKSIESGSLKIFDHNPVENSAGIITVVEFIDFGCPSCLVDANFTHRILKGNENIRFISKLNNVDTDKQLHIANLASLVAASEDKFFEFREKQITSTESDLNAIIKNLDASGVPLREFRRALTLKPDLLLSNLAQDIAQAEHFKVKSYTIFINDRMFSDDPNSKYNLKDITVYLNNL
tara:strand:+ start:2012 stop:2788 length:777 start_codon:yes stop_codon:yes gene_type:complete